MKNFTSFRPHFKIAGSTLVAAFFLCLQACENIPEEAAPQDAGLTAVSSGALSQAEFIDGHYIVVLKEDQTQVNRNVPEGFEQRRQKAKAYGHTILNEKGIPTQALYSAYSFALSGFAAKLTPAQANTLQADPRVAYIERDQIVRLIEPLARVSTTTDGTTSAEAPPGVTRVGGGTATYTGTKRAYVIDTGILMFNNSESELITHPDLNTETSRDRTYNAFCDEINPDGSIETCTETDRYPNDGNGHGTHVAGTIGAILDSKGVVGVAANALVVPVKVLGTNGSGSLSNVLEGLDFVHYDGTAGDVANMSLGASGSTTLDNAVIEVADKGILFAIAAGNDARPAKNYSPARVNHRNVFTIAAMSTNQLSDGTWSDSWASFSNHGQPPIDYISPGVNVYSTCIKVVETADVKSYEPDYASMSGTSMAAPHVAGLLLLNGTAINTYDKVRRTAKDVYNVAHK
ncbi:S8 family serine peptidase [Pontibacter toksunensis]|uniref:S8 family serine peptidase n=1 Tax=Pontibacter toksunensis TaxID=1332631 RepID=A0ABW6BY01_9BACT